LDESLGVRIRQARKSANLSQSQLALKIGAHVTSVSDWERGRNAPSARHLFSIAEATGARLEQITAGDDAVEVAIASLAAAIRTIVRAELRQSERPELAS
jgi:transcriptional regulator with XRE-family HTH domain